MNRDQLVTAIKESYRRLEYGSNDIRIKRETDDLLDKLGALPFDLDTLATSDTYMRVTEELRALNPSIGLGDALAAIKAHCVHHMTQAVRMYRKHRQPPEQARERKALAELVRLKNMKEHIETMEAAGTMLASDFMLKREYEAFKILAWEQALAVLKVHEED